MQAALTFILGVLTGVLSQYFGTRYADKAKSRDIKTTRYNEFDKAKDLMPKLLEEMYNDFKSSANREFFVIISKNISFNASNYIAYYQDEHEELSSKIGYLEDTRFIVDITYTNTPKYRITEEFLHYLTKAYHRTPVVADVFVRDFSPVAPNNI